MDSGFSGLRIDDWLPASMKVSFRFLVPMVALLFCHCAWEPKIAAFTTDGCTLSPEQSPLGLHNWRDCCIEHDLAYWKGGSEEERLAADNRLRACILEETENPRLAKAYFEAVQLGGKAQYPTTYRWGYGWNFLRPPGPLTDQERILVDKRLKEVVVKNGDCMSCNE
jgi:hypothetical protein